MMLSVKSVQEIDSYPRSKWNIPEPPLADEEGRPRADGTYVGDIGVVIVPGVSFDHRCNRLGHGRGYYGEAKRTCIRKRNLAAIGGGG